MSRSYLFIPGNNPNMLQNLDVFNADAVIIDFEDSVISYDKDCARDLVENFLIKYNFENLEIYIRINDFESNDFLKDVQSTLDLNINGYVLPKAMPESIDELNKLIGTKGKKIIPIIESPLALLFVREIASKNNLHGILLGAEDFTKELNVARTLEASEIFYARSIISIACNAFNIDSIDTPFTNTDDISNLRVDSLKAKQLGFTSKSSIHPNHVETINQVFAPSKNEIENALRIVTKAKTEIKGAFSLDGKMVDLPIIKKAEKTIETAKKYNLL